MAQLAMLVDTTLCTGCRGCQVACKQWWDLPGEDTENLGSYENPRDLSPTTWTRVRFHEVAIGDRVQWVHTAWGCLHCAEAACVDVCPTGALRHNALGFVSLDGELCNGCGYCAIACPFDIPRLERSVLTGRGKATKCNFCQDRVTQGLAPACVKTCPAGAIRFGDRAAMVRLGEGRVAALQARGATRAGLYGATILGGLGRMFVLAAAPAAYGLPAQPLYPASIRMWRQVVAPFGRLGVVAALIAIAANAIVGWRLRRGRKDDEVPR